MRKKVIFKYEDVVKLKAAVSEGFAVNVHFHDGCSGQFFFLEEANEQIKAFIEKYFESKNMKTVFSDDGLKFTVEKGTVC